VSFNAAEHEAVAKGLIVAEETHQWCGGSVAAAFERKFPAAAGRFTVENGESLQP
jgi:hypothetical protein